MNTEPRPNAPPEDQAAAIADHRRFASTVAGQITVVVAVGVVVQALLWFRADSAAHVVGGAVLAAFIGVSVPKRWLRVLDAWAEAAVLGVVLAAAWVTEWTIFGPFDAVDIAFTMGGAFLATASLPAWVGADRRERRQLGTAAVLLACAALSLRYLAGLGKA